MARTQPYSGIPGWVYLPAGLGAVFVVLPLVAMISRVDWSALRRADHRPVLAGRAEAQPADLDARRPLLCLLFGVPMALVLARTRFPGQRVVRSLILLPLVLPPVVGGIALLYTFGRRGLLGQSLEVLGIQIAFSTTAVVLAQTFVALPFLVVALEGTLRTVGQPVRGGRRHAGRPADDGAATGHAAVGAARAGVRERCCRSPGPWASSAPP